MLLPKICCKLDTPCTAGVRNTQTNLIHVERTSHIVSSKKCNIDSISLSDLRWILNTPGSCQSFLSLRNFCDSFVAQGWFYDFWIVQIWTMTHKKHLLKNIFFSWRMIFRKKNLTPKKSNLYFQHRGFQLNCWVSLSSLIEKPVLKS